MSHKDMLVVSSLQGMENRITPKRRDGNTIRIVDNAVQILFSGNKCYVQDHYRAGRIGVDAVDKLLAKRILSRLKIEHGYGEKDVAFNRTNNTIWLRKFDLSTPPS